jgi:hypothetical protein
MFNGITELSALNGTAAACAETFGPECDVFHTWSSCARGMTCASAARVAQLRWLVQHVIDVRRDFAVVDQPLSQPVSRITGVLGETTLIALATRRPPLCGHAEIGDQWHAQARGLRHRIAGMR